MARVSLTRPNIEVPVEHSEYVDLDGVRTEIPVDHYFMGSQRDLDPFIGWRLRSEVRTPPWWQGHAGWMEHNLGDLQTADSVDASLKASNEKWFVLYDSVVSYDSNFVSNSTGTGFKGSTFLDTGFVYAPYVPLVVTPQIDIEDIVEPSYGFVSGKLSTTTIQTTLLSPLQVYTGPASDPD